MKLKDKKEELKNKSTNIEETIKKTGYAIGKYDKVIDLKVAKNEIDNEYLFYKKYLETVNKLEVRK